MYITFDDLDTDTQVLLLRPLDTSSWVEHSIKHKLLSQYSLLLPCS